MKTGAILKAAFLLSAMANAATAAAYDGSQPFTCAADDIASCAPGADCEKETAESINLPASLTFDLAANKITGTRPDGEELETSIDSVRHVEDSLAMQGVQGHVVWSVTVSAASGEMALAAMGDRTGYIVFGTCVAH